MSGELAESASGYFGSMAESYDSLIRRAVPRYDEMNERLTEYVPPDAKDVLELGTGTGNLSLLLARHLPGAALTLVDGSADMLAVARSRLERQGHGRERNAVFIESRFEDLLPPANSFDAVVSSISLHHVRDKARIYRRVRAGLRNGGTFCFADQLRGDPERNHALNWERWLDYCRQPGHCSPDEIQSLLDHAAAHDHYVTESEHIALLGDAGFTSIDCVWRNWMWGILTATCD